LTIPHESFTYGLENGSIKFTPSSPEVKKMLKQQSLDYLTNLTLPRTLDEAIIEQHFPTEDVITVTKLTRTMDDFDRPMVNNKTVIIKISDYLKMFPPRNCTTKLL